MIGNELEKYSFEYLINAALEKVPNDIDKREGSIIYDALAPACYQLAEMYMELKNIVLNSFILTSYGKYLDNRVLEQGLKRYSATKAIKKGIFTFKDNKDIELQNGLRFSTINENLIYKIIKKINNLEYELECETLGTEGNSYAGDILPLDYNNSIASCRIDSLLVPGRNEETDEELINRYILEVNQKPFGGNIAQYDREIRSIDGIGEVQIYPTWNGGGTVKCSIIDNTFNAASIELINKVKELIDPRAGKGVGIAPIGHNVTICTPTVVNINIEANVQLLTGYLIEQIREEIVSSINKYFDRLKRSWGIANDLNEYELTVYISQITMAILQVAGVANVTNIKINNKIEDLVLIQSATRQELPFLNEVNFL
ncbi:MAG: baseplate J/gp47 family protein [Clostridium sp.]